MSAYSISRVAEEWGCPAYKVAALWRRGDLDGFYVGRKPSVRTMRFLEQEVAAKRHLASVEIPEPPARRPRPILPALAATMLAALRGAATQEGSFVYFVQCGEFVKIGYTFDPRSRLDALLSGTPHDIDLIKLIAGGLAAERALHRCLSAFRHRREWFRLEPQLLQAIRALPGKRCSNQSPQTARET